MKKRMILFIEIITLVFSLIVAPISFAERINPIQISTSSGLLSIEIGGVNQAKTKIMVRKDDIKYYYDMVDDQESFPLQLGSGEYTVGVLENIEGDRYKFVYKDTFEVNHSWDSVYLNSVQNVKWDINDAPIQFLETILTDEMDDYEKVVQVHDYIANNYAYDYDLYNRLDQIEIYLPSITKTFDSKKGICYDLTSLLAAMLRSEGIPTKLVMGYREGTEEYHAWNEVFINGKWRTTDITLDTSLNNKDRDYTVFKDQSLYDKTGEY